MAKETIAATVDRAWQRALPVLMDYIKVPAQSPAFDPDWASRGELDAAAELLARWARAQLSGVEGARVEVVRLAGLTPSILLEIPGDERPPIFCYGHLDKQPAMEGWLAGRGAFAPSLEDDRLYGRGGADDGYSIFSVILAVLALRHHERGHPPIRMLVEGSEESGSVDLPATLQCLLPRLGLPALVVALDAGCGNYEQLWTTTSLRGQVAGTLTVRTLEQAVHSGDAAGIIPSSFMIARHLLSRLEDAGTGAIRPDFLKATIPKDRIDEARSAGKILGDQVHWAFPVRDGLRPSLDDPAEQLLNRTWRPQLTVTGADGLPPTAGAAAVAQPSLSLRLSLRLPPSLDPMVAGRRMKALLEQDPPYGCAASFEIDMVSAGWNAPPVGRALGDLLDTASRLAWGRPAAKFGGGGGIPFLAMLSAMFPSAQFIVTGVLGPQSSAHGPNEFLHLPTVRRLTHALAEIFNRYGAQP